MNNRTIQAGPLTLDKIILGTGQFGTGYSVEESFAQMDAYFALGGRTLDTASIYGDWEDEGTPISEETIGRWMRERANREEITLITKGCHYKLSTPEVSRVSGADIHTDVARSLEALGTDYIDLYLLHRDNPSIPVEEIVDALAEHMAKGELKAVGASNWTVDRILEAVMHKNCC
ncbi:MAG: aldo/keto reductase [Oscillospiraceae bacterium]